MPPTAIVTGAGRGIGKETALQLAELGMSVAVCSRTKSELDQTVKEMKQIHDRVVGLVCDAGRSAQVNAFVEKVVDKLGPIDVLINNAGIAFVKPIVNTTEKEWDETISSNLKSAFLFTRKVLPGMIRRKTGTIVNVSSGAGKVGFENLSAYCASKFGLMALTESVSWEVASHNIRVMAICPGEVATKMQEAASPTYYRMNRAKMLQPGAVASKIVEMITQASTYSNGQSVDI
ncbi:MAG TPA: SDR family oxidoreductase [Nitrososphaera sp.]|nr:SDR family oxidoreductase [Nitrososphaera sp.]